MRWFGFRQVCPGLCLPLRQVPWAGEDLFTQYIEYRRVQAERASSHFRVLLHNLKHYWLRKEIPVHAFLICMQQLRVSKHQFLLNQHFSSFNPTLETPGTRFYFSAPFQSPAIGISTHGPRMQLLSWRTRFEHSITCSLLPHCQ